MTKPESLVLPELLLGRDQQLAIIERTIRSALDDSGVASPQHLLVVGPHGDGKTALLAQSRLNIDAASGQVEIAFARLGRLTPNISEPSRLLADLGRQVSGAPPSATPAVWVAEGEKSWREQLTHLNEALDARFGNDRGLLVVFVERFDELLNRTFDADEKRSLLRTLLQTHPRLMVVATSHSPDLHSEYDQRIFQAFRIVKLPPLSADIANGCFNTLEGGVRADAVHQLKSFITLAGGRGRRVYHAKEAILAKPSARMADILDAAAEAESYRFSSRLEDIPQRELQIFDALIRGGEPASQSMIADRMLATQPLIGRAVSDLKNRPGVLSNHLRMGRTVLLKSSDRLLAYWYQRRILFMQPDETALGLATSLFSAWLSMDLSDHEPLMKLLDTAQTESGRFASVKRYLGALSGGPERCAIGLMIAMKSVDDDNARGDFCTIAEVYCSAYLPAINALNTLLKVRSSNRGARNQAVNPDFEHMLRLMELCPVAEDLVADLGVVFD